MHLKSPAKINFTLGITGKNKEGYHLIDSLIGFVDVYDHITLTKSTHPAVHFTGPFSQNIDSLENSVAIALGKVANLGKHPLNFDIEITKNIPQKAGLGGGSGNAAVVLQHLGKHIGASPEGLLKIARDIGADVPCFIDQRPIYAGGTGHTISGTPALPPCTLVLAMPAEGLSTADVYGQYQHQAAAAYDRPTGWGNLAAFVAYLQSAPNMLTKTAIALQPDIQYCLENLAAQPHCMHAAMTGSGACCYGIFATRTQAENAATALQNKVHWVKVATLLTT